MEDQVYEELASNLDTIRVHYCAVCSAPATNIVVNKLGTEAGLCELHGVKFGDYLGNRATVTHVN